MQFEAVVDRIGTERHELSGRAKDQGSAAVFIALCIVAVVWGSIFIFLKVRSILSKNVGLCVLHKPFLYNVHKHLYTSAVLDISRYL